MLEDTKEEIKGLQKKLEYIGLDFNNIPEFIKQYSYINFKPSRVIERKRKYKSIQIYRCKRNPNFINTRK